MSLILCIETATTVCSVAVFRHRDLLAWRELNEGYTHAENLHLFISDCLKEAGVAPSELQAVAVSSGPGSYTGLRIGASTAKGLAFALQIPLLAIDTLQVMTVAAGEKKPGLKYYCPLIDARRMEVYTRTFDSELRPLNDTKALVLEPATVNQFPQDAAAAFFGDGMAKCKALLSEGGLHHFIDDIVPSARHMGALALKDLETGQFADTAYFEPFYLKEFLAGKKKESKNS